MRRRLSMEARRELIEAVGERYRKAERTEKKQILDEFVELAGFPRKHAIRGLRSEPRAGGVGSGNNTPAVRRSGDYSTHYHLGSGRSNLRQTAESGAKNLRRVDGAERTSP